MSNKKIFYFLGIILFFTLLYFVIEYIFIPKNIYMTTGESYVVNMSAPFNGEIECDDVINVNNKTVENNIELSLDDENIISCDNESNVDMRVKFLGIPVKKVQLCFMPERKVEVVGRTVGICVDTKGVLVLGVGQVKSTDGKDYIPCKGLLKSGDIIISVNGEKVDRKESLVKLVNSDSQVSIKALRKNEEMNFTVTPIKSIDDNSYKLGLWVRDSTQGIGTITYYDRQNNRFGALGHPINDIDTGKLMEIEGGEILDATIERAEKGKEGEPGALIGNINFNKTLGYVDSNKNNGIFGQMYEEVKGVEMPVGYKNDVKIGNGSIYVNINGKFVDKYSIHIDSINKYNNSDTKNFVLTVTDKRLLNMTGGIVQGMSGCPVVQNGKLVGAVTHVFVNDPTKGYGIFIENMLDF